LRSNPECTAAIVQDHGIIWQSGKPDKLLGVWAAEGIEIAEEKFEAPESRWLDFSDQGNGAATPKNEGF